jgi:Ca-activated chloride channel family protein
MTLDLDEAVVPPRRFGARAIATTASTLVVVAGMTYLVVRDAPEPIAAAGESAAFEPMEPIFMEVRVGEPAIPQLARNFDPDMQARSAGLLGQVQQESGHFLASPYGSAYAVGNDDEDVWGGLTGTEAGEAYGVGGLGLVGSGRGGGGTGEGTIGLGNVGIIGKGGGSGTGHGYGGRGHRISRNKSAVKIAEPMTNESYQTIAEHGFVRVQDDTRSTFSIDVDTASYSNVRRFLDQGQLPPEGAVRVEEFVNYFAYEYDPPSDGKPFAVHSEVADCPWDPDHLLVQVGLKGQVFDDADLPARNFVFLVDVSGSMSGPDRLPLVRQSLGLLVEHLRPIDRVGIVVYAGASGRVLAPTKGDDMKTIRKALERLEAGGSTNGGAGIELAYRLASRHFVEGGANRVILATDGDFNVGVTSDKALDRLIEEKRKSGVFLSVLGYGRGNMQDATMESLADKGNGNYAYIDSIDEARKVLVDEAAATLVTIAKDVKIQVEFDRTEVASWRLVGYENRKLAHRDFTDDTKDAGEIGAGHTVTALYEVVPARQKDERMGPLMRVGLRWKEPDGDASTPMERAVGSDARSLAGTSDDFRLAAAAAQFGMLLRKSPHRGEATWASTIALAEGAMGDEPTCERTELTALVARAAQLSGVDARAKAQSTCKKS